MVFHHQIGIESFPAVYSPHYIFNSLTILALELIESENEDLQVKGLSLLESILKQISPESISYQVLALPVHKEMFKCLSKVMVFSTKKEVRETSTELLKKYLIAFDAKGRFLFIQNAIVISEHSGVIGYLITQIKEFAYGYKNTENYFIQNLSQLLCTVCKLQKGKDTLLFEHADNIISALNVIRFLIKYDPKNINKFGIWNIESYLKNNYTNVLLEALQASREYLSSQLRNAKCLEDYDKQNKSKNTNMTVNVGTEILPCPKYDDEVNGIKAKFNTLDFIAFQLEMVNEIW